MEQLVGEQSRGSDESDPMLFCQRRGYHPEVSVVRDDANQSYSVHQNQLIVRETTPDIPRPLNSLTQGLFLSLSHHKQFISRELANLLQDDFNIILCCLPPLKDNLFTLMCHQE